MPKMKNIERFFKRNVFEILGYTLNPEPNFNLTTGYKNVIDSKKSNVAIIVSKKIKTVIEFKGTNTTDLGKIEV